MLFLESTALSWLHFEGSADCFKNIIGSQSAIESHTVDDYLRIKLSAEGKPVFRSCLENLVIIDCKFWSHECLFDALLDDINVEIHVLHQLITLLFRNSINEQLMRPLHVFEVNRLRWLILFVKLFWNCISLRFHVENVAVPVLCTLR